MRFKYAFVFVCPLSEDVMISQEWVHQILSQGVGYDHIGALYNSWSLPKEIKYILFNSVLNMVLWSPQIMRNKTQLVEPFCNGYLYL